MVYSYLLEISGVFYLKTLKLYILEFVNKVAVLKATELNQGIDPCI